MKLLSGEFHNFGSYDHFEIDFTEPGLTLLYGPTGAGKSSIPDMVAWCLYGVTGKNGNADDVRSWNNPDELTKGSIQIHIDDGWYRIVRERGAKNDLYYTYDQDYTAQRGKDMPETQKRINDLLGADADTYLLSAYFNEFSETNGFFTAAAAKRRSLFEKIADTTFPDNLAEKITNAKKDTKKDITETEKAYNQAVGREDQIRQSYSRGLKDAATWERQKKAKINQLNDAYVSFESNKQAKIQSLQVDSFQWIKHTQARINDVTQEMLALNCVGISTQYVDAKIRELGDSVCSECGNKKASDELLKLHRERNETIARIARMNVLQRELEDLELSDNPYTQRIEEAKALENHYAAQIKELEDSVNPFTSQNVILTAELKAAETERHSFTLTLLKHKHRLSGLERLYDLCGEVRGHLLSKAVSEAETRTNGYLETYFDAEIRVAFALESDSLAVTVYKDGNEASYRQLSKGQRGLLKLCFGVSVMKLAANNTGVQFQQLWFDEALDGLDAELKVKAYSLFTALGTEHDNVFLIDHETALHALADQRYHITLENGYSQVEIE
jgi:DNA repair exonuclease SbcCD ATPase subunit